MLARNDSIERRTLYMHSEKIYDIQYDNTLFERRIADVYIAHGGRCFPFYLRLGVAYFFRTKEFRISSQNYLPNNYKTSLEWRKK